MRWTAFRICARSTGFEIIVKGPIASAWAMRSESGYPVTIITGRAGRSE